MYCPGDVVNFINEAIKKKVSGISIIPGNYWINSTSSNALLSYVGFLSENATGKMQSLMDGDNIETTINDAMNYATLSKHKEEDFFSLLVHTGYLTSPDYRIDEVPGSRPKIIYSLRIPNLEIKKCFKTNIQEHFREVSTQGENKSLLIAQSLLEGNCDIARSKLKYLLRRYVSVRDFATGAKPENFYHGFLSSVFTNCGSFITDFKFNSESEDGYADFIFKNSDEDTVVVIEIKSSDSDDYFVEDTRAALQQIEHNSYYEPFLKMVNVKTIYCYGISLYKKDCYIEMKKVK